MVYAKEKWRSPMKPSSKSLFIDTTEKIGKVCIGTECLTWSAMGKAELVLEKIDQLLKKHKLTIQDITSIQVNPGPGSFTGTRVGVALANALGWSLSVGKPVRPHYSRSPYITKPS